MTPWRRWGQFEDPHLRIARLADRQAMLTWTWFAVGFCIPRKAQVDFFQAKQLTLGLGTL